MTTLRAAVRMCQPQGSVITGGIRAAAIRGRVICALALLVLATCCSRAQLGRSSKSSEQEAGKSPIGVEANFMLTFEGGSHGLRLLGLGPEPENPWPAYLPHESTWSWEFKVNGSDRSVNGRIADPLVVTSEFEAGGRANPIRGRAGAGMFHVDLPNSGGTFVLSVPKAPSWEAQLLSVKVPRLTGFSYKTTVDEHTRAPDN